ncbi:MAG: hypothetical protein ACI4AN_04840 [Muribaculaceae bacterium]
MMAVRSDMMRRARAVAMAIAAVAMAALTHSCIKPPLVLPSEEVIIDLPIIVSDIEVVWNIDTDWKREWIYGWDDTDEMLWGSIGYFEPTNYEVRRYYLGGTAGAPHSADNVDGFTVFGTSFRRNYQFGYYDMLIWSNIDSPDGTQVLVVNDTDVNEVKATTTVTRGISRNPDNRDQVTALFNQPEIFYSTYPRDIYISHDFDDYDYFDEENKCWVKHLKSELHPLVYIYLVQIVLHNNDGRVVGTSGDAAVSAFASSTSVNTGHTGYTPCIVYYGTRMKKDLSTAEGETVDVIGGKLTTFGLCDMDPYWTDGRAEYSGSRSDLQNYLYFTLRFSNETSKTMLLPVTDQCQRQSHGGVITVHVDCRNIDLPDPGDPGSGNLFVPTIEDYTDVNYDIPM